MRFTLTIDCDSTAFTNDPAGPHEEIGRILSELAGSGQLHDALADADDDDPFPIELHDVNGKKVGEFGFNL